MSVYLCTRSRTLCTYSTQCSTFTRRGKFFWGHFFSTFPHLFALFQHFFSTFPHFLLLPFQPHHKCSNSQPLAFSDTPTQHRFNILRPSHGDAQVLLLAATPPSEECPASSLLMLSLGAVATDPVVRSADTTPPR